VNGKSILERQLHALKACNILEIYIVVGHKSEKIICSVASAPNVKTLTNNYFDATGSLGSLLVARPVLKKKGWNRALIVESDLLFEETLLSQLLQSPHLNTIAVSKITLHHDPVFVEQDTTKTIISLSKSRTTRNGDEEFVGLTLLDRNGFSAVTNCSETKREYEHALEISAQEIGLKSFSVSDTDWLEVDTIEDLERAIRRFP
jgi:choline kinase